MKRRHALFGAGGAVLSALAACSKEEPPVPVALAATTATAGASSATFQAASRGTGFVVGQAMAARSVLVFFDPQCPHCAKLWQAAKPLLDRIRMVWMPVAFIGPSSGPQGALMLAAKDPVATMDQHETLLSNGQGGLAVAGAADAGLIEKIQANTQLWKSLEARSVPYMVYRIGAEGPYGVQSGGMATEQLAQLLRL
jgi:thiol:disulfide interchange protein DsbG